MRLKYFFKILFLILPYFAFSQQTIIDINTKNLPLSEVISELEKKYNFLFSYKEADVQNINIEVSAEQKDINGFLKTVLKNTGLEHEIINGNYIILKKTNLPADNITNNSIQEKPLPLICGSVVDSFTQKPLSFASVYFKGTGKGNYSSENGSFNFRSNFSENDTLVVSYVGYDEKRFPVRYFTKNPCPRIQLNYFDFGEDFIVVTDYLTDGIDLADNGAATVMRPERIGALPGQVEPDVFSTIQFLPGINAPSGEASNMYVRGGAADQNLLLWEGIPIYHSAHFFGMISAFNPYIIDKIKVYRGGFGPEYGGRVSSVIDMESAGHDLKRNEFGAGLNFLNAYTHGKISFAKNKASIVYSLRRSISELWRSPTFDNIALRNQQNLLRVGFDFNNIPKDFVIDDNFYFLDGHVKASAKVSEKDNISAAFFHNNNDFDDKISNPGKKEDQIDVLDLKSNGASFTWEHRWKHNITSKLLGSSSIYDYDYTYEITNFANNSENPNKTGHKTNKVAEQQFHFSNILKTRKNHTLKFGYHFTHYDVDYLILHENRKRENPLANEQEQFKSNVDALYGEFSSSNKNKIGVDAGLRLSHYEQTDKTYLSPRLRLWYNLSDAFSVQANAGKYYQFISQLVEFKGDFLGFDTPIWVLNGNKDAPVLEATQYQLGFIFNKNAWVVDLQAYTKEIKGLSSLAIGFETDFRRPDLGRSSSKGLDVLVKKRWKNFRTWVSYSLGKTDYHFPKFFDEDFPAPFDIRHAFQWASQLTVGKFEFSLGMHVCSGSPYSIMTDIKINNGPSGNETFDPIYQAYNDHYLPAQHHLDASILYKIESKTNSKFRGVVGLSFFNIYERENIYNREYYIENPQNMPPRIEVNDKAGLGFTPNAVVRFEW